MPEVLSVPSLMSHVDDAQARLRVLLGADAPSYAERPPNGKWSIVENLRHLLFAEQLHLGRYLPELPKWSPLGLPPTGMQGQARFAALNRPAASAMEVLDAWATVHESTKALVINESPEFRYRLERHLRHLNAHVKVIERMLRARS